MLSNWMLHGLTIVSMSEAGEGQLAQKTDTDEILKEVQQLSFRWLA